MDNVKKAYHIIFTTNKEDQHETTVWDYSYTSAYMQFTCNNPKNFEIIDITEV